MSEPGKLDGAQLMALPDSLLVYRPVSAGAAGIEPFVLLDDSGRVFGFNGHVDLGTGVRTALAQIVAEELDVTLDRVTMILGDTARTPDQGPTIASETIQTSAVPLRAAAAQARRHLLAIAALQLGIGSEVGRLTVESGVISSGGDGRRLAYGELVRGRRERLILDVAVPVKAPGSYRLVGKSVPRVDLPAKVTGELIYVHDVRLPGMLHGRVVRPPYAGIDAGEFVGKSLIRVDRDSVAHLRSIVQVVSIGDFVGIVAEREEDAVAAVSALRVEWKAVPSLGSLDDLAKALRANPSQPRRLQDKGDVERAFAAAPAQMVRTYVWPYQMHASIGPSCAVAEWSDSAVRIWSGTQNPHLLRSDLALLLGIAPERVDVIRMEASGCYGRNCADDVAADAALLSRAVGRPVRVQLTREQEHLWEPKGAAQLMEVKGALDERGGAVSYDFNTRYPSNGARVLALLLTGKVQAAPDTWQMGDRTSVPPYDLPNMRVTVHDMPPIVRASWLRGVSALPNTFAHESWIDEAAAMAGVDPVEYRLRYLHDSRGVAVIEATAERAGWQTHAAPGSLGGEGDVRRGKGLAYALYVHSKFPGSGAAWAAWVADVTVNVRTGAVSVQKVTVGHDAGLMINPDGVKHQIHGNVIQSISRALKEQVRFEPTGVAVAEWGGYPIIGFPEVPEIEVVLVPRPDEPPRGVGESASVPSAAAIANAIYDATGVRFREPPFTPEKILAGLRAACGGAAAVLPAQGQARKSFWAWLLALGASATALFLAIRPWRSAIPPIPRPNPSVYSAATIERGRTLAALGDCAVCHTAPGGERNAGGRRFETPFGAIYSTNITPDVQTGIGGWSYPAFARAMRAGVGRDGRYLYPVFPYTDFSKASDADLQALYAYLMSTQPIHAPPRPNQLAFPFSLRPLMAVWNLLFHHPVEFHDDPRRSQEWNRGAYLVQSLGHCAACHSPRNLLGAEDSGSSYLAGGRVDGWDAPALNGTGPGPLPWTAQDFYDYLREGRSLRHGAAGGPMAAVVQELRLVPESDIRAMAAYLASFAASEGSQGSAAPLAGQGAAGIAASAGARLYDGACAVCHDAPAESDRLSTVPLALSSTVHAAPPDNFILTVLEGFQSAHTGNEVMPAFRSSLSNAQLAELAAYVRGRFAPEAAPWKNLKEAAARLRRVPSVDRTTP